jgi:hypothetical protein
VILLYAIRVVPPRVLTWLGIGVGDFVGWQVAFLMAWVFMIAYIWLLTGFFDLKLWALFLVVGYAGYLIARLLLAFNRPPRHFQHELVLASSEYGAVHGTLARLREPLGDLLHVAYLIAAGFVYFGHMLFPHALPSHLATRGIFSLTFLWSLLVALNLALPYYVSVPLSRNVQERTRTILLIERVGGLLPNALVLSVLLWSFGATVDGRTARFGVVSIALSLVVFAVLLLIFVLAFLLPYLVGFRRAADWRQELLDKQTGLVRDVAEAFEFPDPDRRVAKLSALVERVETETERFSREDKSLVAIGIAHASETTGGVEHPGARAIREACRELRDVDPRLVHLAFLADLKGELQAALGRLASADGPRLERLHSDYAAFYRGRVAALTEPRTREARPWGKAAAAVVVLPIVAGILNEVGKAIWNSILRALGP